MTALPASRPRAKSPEVRADAARTALRDGLAMLGPGLILPGVAILAYELAYRAGAVEARLVPPPSRVAGELWTLARNGELSTHVAATLLRVLSGFAVGGTVGVALGILTGSSRWAHRMLDPTLQALRAIPSLAWVPLFILWLGIFELSKIALIATGVFFPVYLGTMAALLRIDRNLVDLGRVYRAGPGRMIRLIILPALLPDVVTALRSGLGLGFMFVVAAEIMGASEGLGYLLVDGQQMGRADQILASIVVFALLGKTLDGAVLLASRPFLRWRYA